MSRVRVWMAGCAAASVLVLSGCAGQTSTDGSMTAPNPGSVAGEVVADGSVGMVAPAAGGAPAVDSGLAKSEIAGASTDRSVIRSASALLGVSDLDKARAALAAVIAAQQGEVVSEYVKSGYDSPEPLPYAGVAYDQRIVMPPVYGWEKYVDVAFTVPASRYAATVTGLRGLGEMVSLNQSATDVTVQVIDTDAHVKAARASVDRIEALLGQAQTLDETLRLEQELTSRQANLDSLLSQQAMLSSQVARSTISVRMVPQALLDAQPAVTYEEPNLWQQTVTALGAAWAGFVVFLAYSSPFWVLGGLVAWAIAWWVRRRKRGR